MATQLGGFAYPRAVHIKKALCNVQHFLRNLMKLIGFGRDAQPGAVSVGAASTCSALTRNSLLVFQRWLGLDGKILPFPMRSSLAIHITIHTQSAPQTFEKYLNSMGLMGISYHFAL